MSILQHSCAHPGCPSLTRSRYCPDHIPPDPIRQPDTRESAADRGYDAEWGRVRIFYLNRHPFCEDCGAIATLVHHIIPISEGGKRLSQSNLRSLCVTCHEHIHQRQSKRTHETTMIAHGARENR